MSVGSRDAPDWDLLKDNRLSYSAVAWQPLLLIISTATTIKTMCLIPDEVRGHSGSLEDSGGGVVGGSSNSQHFLRLNGLNLLDVTQPNNSGSKILNRSEI